MSPVVFVSLVQGISRCEALAERIRRGPLDVPLQHPYHPHVTVAHHRPEDVMDRAFLAAGITTGTWMISGTGEYVDR